MMIGKDRMRSFQVEAVKVEIYPDAVSLGKAAAQAAAEAIKEIEKRQTIISVIFATGASQLAMLDALTKIDNLPWTKVRGFHMDEYIGLPISHAASFRRYLREKLTEKVHLKEFNEVDGTAPDAEAFSRDYAAKLRAAEPQLCLMGIGENGHLGFNDPPADFETEEAFIVVNLDEKCRRQQLGEGWFQRIDDVPRQAITMSVKQIMKSARIICSVPDSRKAQAVKDCFENPVSNLFPGSILQEHPNCICFLDILSSALLEKKSYMISYNQ